MVHTGAAEYRKTPCNLNLNNKVTGVAHEPGAFTPYELLERMMDEPPRLSW